MVETKENLKVEMICFGHTIPKDLVDEFYFLANIEHSGKHGYKSKTLISCLTIYIDMMIETLQDEKRLDENYKRKSNTYDQINGD